MKDFQRLLIGWKKFILKDKICVIGLGYVGLPTALILAKKGYSVFGVDIDQQKIKYLKKNHTTIEDASSLLENKLVRKNFQAQNDIPSVDSYIVAVPTPLKSNNHANLQYLTDAIKSICKMLKKNNLIIIESTIPPGTCRNIVVPLVEKYTKLKINKDFFLSHCPERAIPTMVLLSKLKGPNLKLFPSTFRYKISKSAALLYLSETLLEISELSLML